MSISPYISEDYQGFAAYKYHNDTGDIQDGKIYSRGLSGDRALGFYIKNIPNEVNDFDGFYALLVYNNTQDISMFVSATTLNTDAQVKQFTISVDDKTVKCCIRQLIDQNNNAIEPIDGIYMGEAKVLFEFLPGGTGILGKPDDGGKPQNSIFPILDEFLMNYNQLLTSKFILKNKQNSFEIDLADDKNFNISNIRGLSHLNEDVASYSYPNGNGDVINNLRTPEKDVTITLLPNSDNVDGLVQALFSKFYKNNAYIEWITHRWIDDWYSKNWQLHGVATEIEVDRFSQKVQAELTLHCSNPFWQGKDVVMTIGNGGLYEGEETANTQFLRTKSYDTGIRLNISTNGYMGGSGIEIPPKNSDFSIAFYSKNDIADSAERTLLQRMKFNGKFGNEKENSTDLLSGISVNYDIHISTEFRKKNAVEKITNVNMLDKMSNDSKFLILNQDVCEIDFGELFSNVIGSYNPYVTLEYTPLYFG